MILKNTFYQLLAMYSLLIVAVAFGFLGKYTLQFHLFAAIIALLGIIGISKENRNDFELNKTVHYSLLILALVIIIGLRFIPYISNTVPLGYDAPFYKYTFEHGLENHDRWIITEVTQEPLFTYLFHFLNNFMSSQFMMTWLFFLFCALLGFALYVAVKEYFNKTAALISLAFYAFSTIQFKTFEMMYYRNIIGLALILFAFYFLRKMENEKQWNNRWTFSFIATGIALGAIHRPSFYMFGLTYFFYAFISPYTNRKYSIKTLRNHIIFGTIIIIGAALFYLGPFFPALVNMIQPVAEGFSNPGEAAGTFINFFTYIYSILPYMPLGLLGLFYFIKRKEINPLVLWAVLNFCIVFFQFFFFNRFIIFLDVICIALSGIGAYIIIQDKRWLGISITAILLIASAILGFDAASHAKPLVTAAEIETIMQLQNTEPDSFAMTTSSIYSPYILGYSDRKTIAPGLLDYDNHTRNEWMHFWSTKDIGYVKSFMADYGRPLYVFTGRQQSDIASRFPACFEMVFQNQGSKIYRYVC